MISHEIPISHSIDLFILLCVYIWCHGGRGDSTCIPGGQKNYVMSLSYRRLGATGYGSWKQKNSRWSHCQAVLQPNLFIFLLNVTFDNFIAVYNIF